MSNINNTTNSYNLGLRSQVFKGEETQSKIPIITKPIDKVENIVNSTVDVFIPETKDEEKKKSHKNMIRAGSTVLVLSAIVLLFNPKFSSSFINKLKRKSTQAGDKAKVDNSFWGVINKVKEKFLKGVANTIQIINNGNSTKDTLFKKLCDKTNPTKKWHQWVTRSFDSISKHTVFLNYKKANKKMNVLDEIIKQYKERLSSTDKTIFETKMAEIKKIQEYFTEANTKERLLNQENLMKDLEKDVTNRLKSYANNFLKSGEKRKDIFNYWAEEALASSRKKVEAEGNAVVEKLIGDGNTQKGAYRELLELLGPHLQDTEKAALEERIAQTGKKLKQAKISECAEYFDKKRDLTLGSAPTDIVTAVLSLLACGVAIGRADTKEDRISKAITRAFPVVAGLGVSTALTALLFSGSKGMMLGAVSGMILSGVGSGVNRFLFPKNHLDNKNKNTVT